MQLTVVVPTRNEADNVGPLVARTSAALAPLGLRWEIVFVDDSDDATPHRIAQARRSGHPVRLLRRPVEERSGGLGSAVALGFERSAASDVLVVMDADLQHPPEALSALVAAVCDGDADLAIASRATRLGNGGSGPTSWWRGFVSRSARALVYALFPHLRHVADPLAGFFAVRRSVLADADLRPEGFKILLEVLVRGAWTRIVEIPCELDPRLHGRSKAHLGQGVAFARHLLRLHGTATDHPTPPACVKEGETPRLRTDERGRRDVPRPPRQRSDNGPVSGNFSVMRMIGRWPANMR